MKLRAHLQRSFAGQVTIGHLVFLAILPVIIAIIPGWFGLGVFKPWPNRLAAVTFWIGITTVLWSLSYLIYWALKRIFSVTELGPTLAIIGCVSAACGTVFFRPVASFYHHIYGLITGYEMSRVLTPLPDSLESFLSWHLDYVPFIILWTFGVILLELYSQNGKTLSRYDQKNGLHADRFRLAMANIEDKSLIAVSAEGHYIRIYTTVQDIRLNYRFSSALDIIADLKGVRIHRSHWVHLAHVTQLETYPNRAYIELSNGLKLPVSLTYRDNVAFALGAAGHNIITQ